MRVDVVTRDDLQVLYTTEPGSTDAVAEAAARAFERLEGSIALRGRRMFGYWDPAAGVYHACGSLLEGDDPAHLGFPVGVIPGGVYRRGRLRGEDVYDHIAPGFDELSEGVEIDRSRPWLEYYRREHEVDLLVPLASS